MASLTAPSSGMRAARVAAAASSHAAASAIGQLPVVSAFSSCAVAHRVSNPTDALEGGIAGQPSLASAPSSVYHATYAAATQSCSPLSASEFLFSASTSPSIPCSNFSGLCSRQDLRLYSWSASALCSPNPTLGCGRRWFSAAAEEAGNNRLGSEDGPSDDAHPIARRHGEGDQTEEVVLSGSLISPCSNPAELSADDVGKIFALNFEDQQKWLPESIPSGISEEWAQTRLPGIMYRRTIHDLIEVLRGKDPSRYWGSGFVLDGAPQSGRSMALLTAVTWARAAGWLVVYVPSVMQWTQKCFYYSKHEKSGMWDVRDLAQNFLSGMISAHQEVLASLPIRRPLPASLPAVSNLLELCQRGVDDENIATDAVIHFRDELTSVKDVPVLIAVDEYNGLYLPTTYLERTGHKTARAIHATEFRLMDAFRVAGELQLENGIFIGATTSALPHDPREGLPGLKGRHRHNVPRYNEEETASMLLYYAEVGVIMSDITPALLQWFHHLTNGNGRELRELAAMSG